MKLVSGKGTGLAPEGCRELEQPPQRVGERGVTVLGIPVEHSGVLRAAGTQGGRP